MRILEVTGRARQGKTKPFICRARDERLYYVKGHYAGYRSMICEWIAGRLAQQLGLPVAPFEIVDVPRALIEQSLDEEDWELGVGEAFGSQHVEFADVFQWSQRKLVEANLAARVLVFDWWVCNSDRVLGAIDGNVNLLWTNAPGELHLIDHNNAFSSSVLSQSWSDFCADHVFGQGWQGTTHQQKHLSGPRGALEVAAVEDFTGGAKCHSFGADCHSAFLKIEELWDELPEKWTESCPNLDYQQVKTILQRAKGILWSP